MGSRFFRLPVLSLLLSSLLPLGAAHAQNQAASYPQRPVSIIVAWSPGGAVDLLSRQLGTVLSEQLGQTVVVDNKAGANGTIGHAQAARATPDGHTVIMATNSTFVIAPHLYASLPYQHERDLAPVSLVAASPLVLAIRPSLGVKSVEELLAMARREPGKLNVASGGNGSTSHLAAEQLMAMTGVHMTHVPYKGGAPATTAVAAGEVDLAFLDLGVALPFIRSNRVQALGVTSKQRSGLLPNVPTVAESAVKDFELTTAFAVFVPAKTPVAIIDRLSTAISASLRNPELRAKLDQQGVIVIGAGPGELRDYTEKESKRWGQIIRERNISLN